MTTIQWILTVATPFLTAIYVFATLRILKSNNRIADATRRQVDELQRQFQEQNRPHVSVQIENVRDGLICLSIANLGNSPARNLKFLLHKDFIDNLQRDPFASRLRKLTQSSIYLSPRQKLYCSLGTPADYERLKTQPLVIDVTYAGDGHEYKEHMQINMDDYSWVLLYESPLGDISSHIKNISESIEGIENKLR